MDIQDQFTAAIQHYAITLPNPELQLTMNSIAENMAAHLIEHMGFKQEYAVAAGFPDAEGGELIDDIDDEDTDRDIVLDALDTKLFKDQQEGPFGGRRFLATRVYQDWAEEVVHTIDMGELGSLTEEQILELDVNLLP